MFLDRLRHHWVPPKTLCLICHYFGEGSSFEGQSTRGNAESRLATVELARNGVSSLPNFTVKMCGIEGNNLLPLDSYFPGLLDPRLLVYEVISSLPDSIGSYDYAMVIEDDILVGESVIQNIFNFDRTNPIDECLHPNRIERLPDGVIRCSDLDAHPGWTGLRKQFKGTDLAVAINPHSAFLMLSKQKIRYASEHVDLSYRGTVIGGPMASAFANIHKPFKLFRPVNDFNFHTVEHLDRWIDPYGIDQYSKVQS